MPKTIEEFLLIFDCKEEKKSLASQFWRNLQTNISRIKSSNVEKISQQHQTYESLKLKYKSHYELLDEQNDLLISNLVNEVKEK